MEAYHSLKKYKETVQNINPFYMGGGGGGGVCKLIWNQKNNNNNNQESRIKKENEVFT